MIRIEDVTRIDDKKRRIKKEIYTKIYEQFACKLRQTVEYGNKHIFMTVPPFLLGYPVFDRGLAARYVARQFSLGGFTVELVGEYVIYVTWTTGTKKKKEDMAVEEEHDFPNLMNLKKIANKYRRSA